MNTHILTPKRDRPQQRISKLSIGDRNNAGGKTINENK